MRTTAPGYATTAQVEQAASIRAAARRGTPAAEIAAAAELDVTLVHRMLECRTIDAAAKLLAESVSGSQPESPTTVPERKVLRSYLHQKGVKN